MTADTLSPGATGSQVNLANADFGVWRAQRQLGIGGMGAVYLVEHRMLRSLAAVKVLHAHLASDPEGLRRFSAEAEAVSRLNHPGIVNVFDIGVLPSGQPWFAMEYVSGTTVDAELMRSRFSIERTINIVSQLASTLDRAHDQGVIHRDLKPANVMLTRSGQLELVKIVDFGIAKFRDNERHRTLHGAIIGTPDYMSPEQILGQPVDARTDVYALGVMTWELLVGAPPFGTRSVSEVLVAHLDEPPAPPSTLRSDVPEGVVSAVLKALAKKPEERFSSAGAFAEALRLALGAPLSARATPLPVYLSAGSARGRRAQLVIDGENHPVICEEESTGGCFVASTLKPPLFSTVSLLVDELGEVSAKIVRCVDVAEGERWSRQAGFFLQFLALTPWQRVLLSGGAAADLFAEESLARWREHMWGNSYEALKVPLDASMSALAKAFAVLVDEFTALESTKLSPVLRDEVELARARLTAVWSTVGTVFERAKYDAALANWRGVAACINAGLPLSELSSLRIDFLRDAPDAEHRGRMLMRSCRTELTNDRPAQALMHLEAALTLDPLNWLMHETRRMVVDLQPEKTRPGGS